MSTRAERISAYLQRVFAREALIAVAAREWLNCQVDALMSLQVVIAIEALWTLVASDWSIVLSVRCSIMIVHLLVHCRMATVVVHGHALTHAVDQRQLTVWVANIR
jgi:hypothetical protein